MAFPRGHDGCCSSWCNSCTADTSYDWRIQCEVDPHSESCNAALELMCKHHNDSCRTSVCEYDGPEETKAVLQPWCKEYNSKCKLKQIIEDVENAVEDHEAAGLGLGLAIGLAGAGYLGRQQIRSTAQSFRRGVGRWWVPEYETNLSLDGNGHLRYRRNRAPEVGSVYDDPTAVYPERNRWQMWMDSGAAQQRIQDQVDEVASFRAAMSEPRKAPFGSTVTERCRGYTMAPDGTSTSLTGAETDQDEEREIGGAE